MQEIIGMVAGDWRAAYVEVIFSIPFQNKRIGEFLLHIPNISYDGIGVGGLSRKAKRHTKGRQEKHRCRK
jgi:hypothetical protein